MPPSHLCWQHGPPVNAVNGIPYWQHLGRSHEAPYDWTPYDGPDFIPVVRVDWVDTMRGLSAFAVGAAALLSACVSDAISDLTADNSPMTGSISYTFNIKSWDGGLDCYGESSDMAFDCLDKERMKSRRGRLELTLDTNGNITSAQARFSNGHIRPVTIRPNEVYGLNFEKLKTNGIGGGGSRGGGYQGNCATDDDVDAAGRRCGKRSAASRPGGY